MTPVSFMVPGIPVAKGRPRFSRKSGVAYTPAKTVAAERGIAQCAAEAMAGRELIDQPCELKIVAVFLAPKRTRKASAAPDADFKPTRPDVDNYVKAIMDACNGVVWRDDSLVAAVHAAKIFGLTPGLRIRVEPLSFVSWPVCRGMVG